MKNKEYIRWLKQLDEGLTFDGLVNGKEKVDLHEMIFELCEKLEQEPCEDCIPRNTVLTLINDVKQVDGFREYSQYSYLFDQVDNIPSVKPTNNLDEIRAEIEQITDTMGVSYNQYVSKIDVLEILDKYTEEKE